MGALSKYIPSFHRQAPIDDENGDLSDAQVTEK